jgi:hypothetical protein
MPLAVLAVIAAVVIAGVAARRGFVRFRQHVRAHLEHSSDIEWRRDTPTGAICAVLGYVLDVDLLATYVYHLRRGGHESVLLDDLAAALRGRVPPTSPPPAALVRDRILPLLKRTASLPPPTGYVPENRLVRSQLDDKISVVYVIEGQHRFTFVTEGMRVAWGIDGAALHDLALTNLRTRTIHLLEELGGPQTEYVSLDGFDATRVLVADLIVPAGIAQPLLAIPHDHVCLIADVSERIRLAAQAAQMFQTALVPLTPRLFRLTADGLHPESAERPRSPIRGSPPD